MKTSIAAAVLALGMAGAVPAQEPAALGAFQTGELHAGPRIWLGNLNGAMAIGGQVERGLTRPQQYGPGIVSGGVGVDYYSWSQDYALANRDWPKRLQARDDARNK